MAEASKTGLILLHGLPESPTDDPFARLRPLVEALAPLVAAQSLHTYHWRADLPPSRGGVGPVLAALDGTLGHLVAPLFDHRWHRYQAEHPDIDRWILGGYSAGGWILYQWLVGWEAGGLRVQPAPSQRERITLMFTIGSPYQNVHDFLYLGGKLRRAQQWSIPPASIVRALRPTPLHVVYSLSDTTVWPDNAAFPELLVPASNVQQLQLPDTNHDTLCADPAVIAVIQAAVSQAC